METYYNDRRLDIVFNDGRVDSYFPTIRVFESATTVDSSTGNLRERTSVKFTIKYLETPESPCAELRSKLIFGRSGVLTYAPEGTDTDKPAYSCNATVLGVVRHPHDDITVVSATLVRNGEWIHHYEELGSIF